MRGFHQKIGMRTAHKFSHRQAHKMQMNIQDNFFAAAEKFIIF